MLKRSGESGQIWIISDLRGKAFRFLLLHLIFTVKYDKCEFAIYGLSWGSLPLFLFCWELSKMDVEFCEMLFLHLLIIWYLSFILLMWWLMLIDLLMLNYPCICRVKDKNQYLKRWIKSIWKSSEFIIKNSHNEYRGNVSHHNKDYTWLTHR